MSRIQSRNEFLCLQRRGEIGGRSRWAILETSIYLPWMKSKTYIFLIECDLTTFEESRSQMAQRS